MQEENTQKPLTLWIVRMRLFAHDLTDYVYARDEQHARLLALPLLWRHCCPTSDVEMEPCPFGFGTGSTFLPGTLLDPKEHRP